MEFDNWLLIEQIAIILASLATGGMLVPVINAVKGWLGLSGNGARALTIVASILVSVALAVVEGLITGDVQMEQLATITLWVIASSQYWYGVLSEEEEEDPIGLP